MRINTSKKIWLLFVPIYVIMITLAILTGMSN
ncbi:Uncharacterised protein [Mycobacteroides abscessus subsp. abscessus]|nr:Uncharacterised protein [Mycobacteroides abscessus subsp. abscessus]